MLGHDGPLLNGMSVTNDLPRQFGKRDCLNVRCAALVTSPSETVIFRLYNGILITSHRWKRGQIVKDGKVPGSGKSMDQIYTAVTMGASKGRSLSHPHEIQREPSEDKHCNRLGSPQFWDSPKEVG